MASDALISHHTIPAVLYQAEIMGSVSRAILGLLSVLSLPGCATITRGTTEVLVINTDPLGADVEISVWASCRSPCSVELKRKHDYHVIVQKDGYAAHRR